MRLISHILFTPFTGLTEIAKKHARTSDLSRFGNSTPSTSVVWVIGYDRDFVIRYATGKAGAIGNGSSLFWVKHAHIGDAVRRLLVIYLHTDDRPSRSMASHWTSSLHIPKLRL